MNRRIVTLFLIVIMAFSTRTAVCSAQAEPPRIGLVYTAHMLDALESGERDGRAAYRAAIEAAGGMVVALGQTHPPALITRRLDDLDGVLLPGGIDVAPVFYNESEDERLEQTDAALDQFEFRILDHARRNQLPIFGICRGHQLLNVYYGGSLIQDIPTQHESDTPVIHRTPARGKGWATHPVTLMPGTILHETLRKDRIETNSSHHQAVKRLAEGFIVSARGDDGIIEAIERPGAIFIVGVQWHPERMVAMDEGMRRLFDSFIAAARQTRKSNTS